MDSIDKNKMPVEEGLNKDLFEQQTFFKLPLILPNSSTRTTTKTNQSELNLSQIIPEKETRPIYIPTDQLSAKIDNGKNVSER